MFRVAIRIDEYCPISQDECEKLVALGAEVLPLDFQKLGNLFEGVSKVLMFSELGVVENIIKETELLLTAATTFKIKHIIKSRFVCLWTFMPFVILSSYNDLIYLFIYL